MITYDLGYTEMVVCMRLTCDMQSSIQYSTDAWLGMGEMQKQNAGSNDLHNRSYAVSWYVDMASMSSRPALW